MADRRYMEADVSTAFDTFSHGFGKMFDVLMIQNSKLRLCAASGRGR